MNHAANTSPEPGIELPFLGRMGISALGLAAANAALLVVYFVYDATLFQLVLVYWCECLWIGVFSAVKLIVASLLGSPYENRWASVSKASALLTSIVAVGMTSSTFFSLLGLLLILILAASEYLPLGAPDDLALNQVGFVFGVSFLFLASHGLSLIGNFLLLGEFRRARAGALLALPFKRCVALLAAIVAALGVVAVVPALATTSGFAAALIVVKLGMDIRLHVGERNTFAAEP